MKLQVTRGEFLGLLKQFRKLCKPSRGEEAVLTFSNGFLAIELGGMSEACAATGTFPIQGRIPGAKFMAMSKVPPRGDPILLYIEEEKLKIGTTVFKANWQLSKPNKINLPMQPTISDLLTLKLKHTDEEITEAGHTKSVEFAEKKCQHALRKADKWLGQFHVTRKDLRQLIDECLLREFGKS